MRTNYFVLFYKMSNKLGICLFEVRLYYPYLCRILGQWDTLLVSRILFRWLQVTPPNQHLFVKKKNSKMRHLKKLWNQWKSIGPALVSRIFFRCLIFDCYNISICKKGKVKDETSKKFVKPMEVKLRSKMSHWPKIPHRYV